ncbi:hypothetical protein N665_0604s0001 [Sinapis alba]|nr:hypothetical protein N665_0604s0001 [Sinapis alba]
MAGDQKGEFTKEESLLIESITNQVNQTMKDTLNKIMKKRRMPNQKLEPRPPDYVQHKSSKHKRIKEEDAGRGHQSFKQPSNPLSRPNRSFLTAKSIDPFSEYKSANEIQLYSFSGKGNYLQWERTMDKWLCYNRIMKKERLAFAMSQLQGNAYKWCLQEEDDRRFYKEPAITTWESLKLILRSKYASKGYTSQKSPMKEVTSSRKPTCYSKEKTDKHSWFSKEDIKKLSQLIMDVGKPLKRTNTARPSIEAQHQEPVTTVPELKVAEPDSAALFQEAQTETSKEKEKSETEQECSLFLPQFKFNINNSFDELTCLEQVQPSSLVSVSHVAEENSQEKEPEYSTQGEELKQQNNLQQETILETLSYDLQENCKEFNMAVSVMCPRSS